MIFMHVHIISLIFVNGFVSRLMIGLMYLMSAPPLVIQEPEIEPMG